MTIQLLLGDCLDELPKLEANSVDAIVTDPPYGLSDGNTEGFSDRLGRILLDVVLPDLYDANVSTGRLPKFGGPLACVSFLDGMNRAVGEETRIAVPESSIDLKRSASVKHEVEHKGEGPVGPTESDLPGVSKSKGVKHESDFILQLRADRDTSFRDSARRLFRKLDTGRFCVPVVIPADSRFSRFLSTLQPCGASFLSDLVRFCNDTGGQPSGAAGVLAGRRAEVNAVLTFDLRRRTVEFSATDRAGHGDLVFLLGGAEPVRASTGAGSLPAKFEPCDFSFVGDATNKAITLHFHKDTLQALHYSRKGFMGKEWDSEVPGPDFWRECLRILKPGGHLLAFAGTRTQHRMATNIEDAGFEIRDMIGWIYGSGFPKSLDVSKAIDKAAGHWRGKAGGVVSDNGSMSGGNYERTLKGDPITAAAAWQGWGTALKPALEPITVARKPLIGTVADNVLQHGTGAINIDGCRVPAADGPDAKGYADKCASVVGLGSNRNGVAYGEWAGERHDSASPIGRWPANLIHDGSEEVVALFPDSNGSGGSLPNVKITGYGDGIGNGKSEYFGGERTPHDSGKGSAARFFYCAKASRKDRNEGCEGMAKKSAFDNESGAMGGNMGSKSTQRENHHPTVKPTDLMRYLCRLVTPPGGVVLDPFMGSGSTGKAAVLEGFRFIGIEREADYYMIAWNRIMDTFEKVRSQ